MSALNASAVSPLGPPDVGNCAGSMSRSPTLSRPSWAVPAKRNRFVRLSGGVRGVNRELEDKARAPADLRGYVTNLAACPDGTPVTAEFAIRRSSAATRSRFCA